MTKSVQGFNKDQHRLKMKPHVDILAKYLKEQHNISFEPTDGHLENVILTRDDVVMRIAHQCFYRFSGIAYIQKEVMRGKKIEIELIEVTDEMFINSYMRSIILYFFKRRTKE